MSKSKNRKPREERCSPEEIGLAQALGTTVEPALEEPEEEGKLPEQPEENLPEQPKEGEAPEGGENVPPQGEVEVSGIEDVIRKLVESIPDEGIRAKAIVEVSKLYAGDVAKKQSDGWVKFDEEFKPQVTKLIEELVKKFDLKPKSQRIVIMFPEGVASYSRGLKGKNGASPSNRDGFPSQWGKAMAGDEEFSSPSKMAEKLGCRINGAGTGYSDMVDVFDSQNHPVVELPKGVKLDELLSKQTDPARKAKLEALAGSVFRVK